MAIRPRFLRLFVGLSVVFILSSCTENPLIPEDLRKNGDVAEFLNIALDEQSNPQTRYTALEPLISQYRSIGARDYLTVVLSRVVAEHPDDPYAAYYLMALAEGAREDGAMPLAMTYWRRLLASTSDLDLRGRSIHLLAMGEVASRTDDPWEAIALQETMLRRYPDRIDTGAHYYAMAKAYEEAGEWNAMYRAYQSFLEAPETVIPGVPEARKKVQSLLAFHASDKSWTMESLDDLVATVKYAIRTVNPSLFTRYRADEFFLMNWSQESTDSFTHIPMELGSFLKTSIRYRADLEPFSNNDEAYLWTYGWTYQMPTWYLYFRRVDYPANPEINGRWEWAGIYYGDRL